MVPLSTVRRNSWIGLKGACPCRSSAGEVVQQIGEAPVGPLDDDAGIGLLGGQTVYFHLQAPRRGAGEARAGPADVRRDGLQGGEESAIGGFGVENVVGDLVQPVPCLPRLSEGEVVQVQAVGGGPVAGPGSELPPELGALTVVGQVEQAGEDEGTVDVQVVHSRRVVFLGEAVDVVGGVGLVEDPAADHGQSLPGLGGADGVRVRLGRDGGRVGGEAAQGGADVEAVTRPGGDAGVGQEFVDGGHCPAPFLFLPGAAGRPSRMRRRSLPLRPW
uniref:Uncharacterized protein n=1 Tax=Streptomyces sp. FR1 TaxID=349971 RepID=V9Z3R5_9ACTN|nr:hypothetical protein pFRL2_83c [Streptomyces sp. FR1]